ncbi:hypothetical protein FOZG_17040 [Fusarium oxysporum Fo47]|uniref:Uncharacterized protein n=1 Tax=Fusarium oxysporum Fo47 TaxID=660027 RepID=W9JC23_FUSOX|nr:hypothetical protein FOZG_17040 [Fusarium oxysporum Fo47]
MAHSIEPVARQRDGISQPLMKPDFRRVEIGLCVWQFKTASMWSRPDGGRGNTLHLVENR